MAAKTKSKKSVLAPPTLPRPEYLDVPNSLLLGSAIKAQRARCYESAVMAMALLNARGQLGELKYVEGFVGTRLEGSGIVINHGWLQDDARIVDAGLMYLLPFPKPSEYFAGVAWEFWQIERAMRLAVKGVTSFPLVWELDSRGKPMDGAAIMRAGRGKLGMLDTRYAGAWRAALRAVFGDNADPDAVPSDGRRGYVQKL